MKIVNILILSVVNMICFGQNISDLTFGLIKPKVACPDTLRMKNALQTPVIEMDYYKENGKLRFSGGALNRSMTSGLGNLGLKINDLYKPERSNVFIQGYLYLEANKDKKLKKKRLVDFNNVSKYCRIYEDSLAMTEVYKNRRVEWLDSIKRREQQISDSLKAVEKEKRLLDSLRRIEYENQVTVFKERQRDFVTPLFIYRNISRAHFTKSNIEEVLHVSTTAHRGGVDFYEINDMFVGLRFYGREQIGAEISFRLFGDQAADYEQLLMNSGYVLKSRKKTSTLELEPDFNSQLLSGELRTYRKGDVVCVVMDGSYRGFTFYAAK